MGGKEDIVKLFEGNQKPMIELIPGAASEGRREEEVRSDKAERTTIEEEIQIRTMIINFMNFETTPLSSRPLVFQQRDNST